MEVQYINVLQAISDWGNSVSAEASSLAQYNTELANIELETGTILETHGVFFFEDRFCCLGPQNVPGAPALCHPQCQTYPRDIRAGENDDQYPVGDEPAENAFDLDDYPQRRRRATRPEEQGPADLTPPANPTPPERPRAEPLGLINPAATSL